MKNKLLIFTTILFAALLFCCAASADPVQCGTDVYYELNGTKMTVWGTGRMDDYDPSSPWSGLLSKITEVEIAAGVTYIGDGSFSYCQELTTVTIPYTVTEVGKWAFHQCVKLSDIRFSPKNNLQKIGMGAFAGTAIESFTYASDLQTIGESAFSGCANLKEFKLSESVTNIGEYAFASCTSLKEIVIPNTLDYVGESAFSNSGLEKVTIRHNCGFQNGEGGVYLESPFYTAPVKTVVLAYNAAAESSSTPYFLYDGFSWYFPEAETVIVSEGITGLGMSSFSNMTHLKNVTLPDSLTNLGNSTFEGCVSLASITLPDSITEIGPYTFRGCTALQSVSIPSEVTAIEQSLFEKSGIKSITLPEIISYISTSAFLDCNYLADIYYAGTQEQWNEIPMGDENESLLNATLHCNGSAPIAADGVAISADNFPDEIFREHVRQYDTNNDGVLSDGEIAAVTMIDVSLDWDVWANGTRGIQDMKGVEFFTSLEYLYCGCNSMQSLDVRKNTQLVALICGENELTSLDVSKNTKLERLALEQNPISSLDVSHNPALKELYCWNCGYYDKPLSKLNLSKNTRLVSLACGDNQMKKLDLSKNTALLELYCSNNQLTELDLSKQTRLAALDCSSNQLSSLNLSKNTVLIELYCTGNQLTKLDLSKNTKLDHVNCSGNKLSSLNLSQNTKLLYLDCSRNKIKTLDVSSVPELVKLVEKEKSFTEGKPAYKGWYKETTQYDTGYISLYVDTDVKVITQAKVAVTAVKLNKTKATLHITLSKKPTLQLKVTVSPKDATDKSVTWKSSDKKVATVSKTGKVTAVGAGTCKITATANDGSKKKATCTITVVLDEVQDSDLKYSLNHDKKTATVIGARKSSLKQATLPSTIKANGTKYKVTAVGAKAFKGMTKLTTFNTGKNLTTIGASAFEGCTSLNTIGIQSGNISKIGQSAFKNIHKKPTLLVTEGLTEKYINKLIKLLTNGGIKKITQIFE